MEEIVLTREGLARLEEELEQLTTVRRWEIGDQIRLAREAGTELAENAEYLAAMEEQQRLEQRIADLQDRLARARVVEPGDVPADTAGIGSHVRIKDLEARETMEYEIVGSGEGNPSESRVSIASPVGAAVLGRREGEVFDVDAPAGRQRLKILNIRPPTTQRKPTRPNRRSRTNRRRS